MKAMKPGLGAAPFHPGMRRRHPLLPEVISALSAALHQVLTVGRSGIPGGARLRPWKGGEKPKSAGPGNQGWRP